MTSYNQQSRGCAPAASPAYSLGQSLGTLFFTTTKFVAGGIRMVRGSKDRDCDCHRCSTRYCDCVECLPPVYAGCCRNCGE
jgi:hypothetical protein